MNQDQTPCWSFPSLELLRQLQTTPEGLMDEDVLFLGIGIIVALYIGAAEIAKRFFYKRVDLLRYSDRFNP